MGQKTPETVRRRPNPAEAEKSSIPSKPSNISQSTRTAVNQATSQPTENPLYDILTEKFQQFRELEASFPQGKDKKLERRTAKAGMLLAMQRALKLYIKHDNIQAARTIKNQLRNRMPQSMTEEEVDAMLPDFVLELLK